jgi:hypothetical protein
MKITIAIRFHSRPPSKLFTESHFLLSANVINIERHLLCRRQLIPPSSDISKHARVGALCVVVFKSCRDLFRGEECENIKELPSSPFSLGGSFGFPPSASGCRLDRLHPRQRRRSQTDWHNLFAVAYE